MNKSSNNNNIISILEALFPGEGINLDNTVLVVGCGISISSGLPDGQSYTNKVLNYFNLEKKLPEWINSINEEYLKGITGNVAVGLYSFPRLESVLNTLQNSLSTEQFESFLIGTLYADKEIKSNLYHRLIAEYIHDGGTVLTFNFDKLVEAAYQELFPKNQMDNICIFPMETETIPSNKGLYIKAHGCFSQPSKVGMTLNKLFINGFPDSSSERRTLDSAFHSGIKNIVSIGYSFSDSIDFTPYLKERGKDFNYIHFQYDRYNNGKFVLESLSNIAPNITYKYVLDSILNKGNGHATIVFFNEHCFINQLGSWWTGTINVNPKIARVSMPSQKSPEYSLAFLTLIYEYGLSEYSSFTKDTAMNEEMDLHRNSVLQSKQIPYMKRLFIRSCYLNRDLHDYLKHFLLFFLNIFSFKRSLLRRLAVFQGTIIQLIFTANKRDPDKHESEREHKLKTFRNLIIAIPILIINDFLLSIGLVISKALKYDRFCAKHNPPLDDYLIAYRRHYQPFYALAEYLRYKVGWFIPNWIVKLLEKRIQKCSDIACELNNLIEYRYIRKEELITKMLSRGKKDEARIIKDYNDLILFDADINYFIEVRNVSKKKNLTLKLLENERDHC